MIRSEVVTEDIISYLVIFNKDKVVIAVLSITDEEQIPIYLAVCDWSYYGITHATPMFVGGVDTKE